MDNNLRLQGSMIIGGRGGWDSPPPNRQGSGENQARGPGGNGIGGPRRRKIGRIWGPTVGRGSGVRSKCAYQQFIRKFL